MLILSRPKALKRSGLSGRKIVLAARETARAMEPHVGVEPTTSPWQGDILPLN